MAEVSHLNLPSFNLYIKISYTSYLHAYYACMFTVPENVENAFTELGYCVYNVPFDGDCALTAIKYKYTKNTHKMVNPGRIITIITKIFRHIH